MIPSLARILPLATAAALCFVSSANASLREAEITRVHKEVRILPENAPSRDAVIGDRITGATAVRTGDVSRAELRFSDQTLTRLGANTQFSFITGTRDLSLDQGVIFLQVPRNAGGARVRTAAVTAAVTGTTIMIEYLPGDMIKVIVIEGTLDLYFPDRPKEFITLKPGQMIVMSADAKSFPRPVDVDLKTLLGTSRLANEEEFGDLGDEAGNAIANAIADQEAEKKDGKLIPTNLVLPGSGTRLLVLDTEATLAMAQGARIVASPGTSGGTPPNPPPPAGSGPGGSGPGQPPGPQPPPPPPVLAGTWIIDEMMLIDRSAGTVLSPAGFGEGRTFMPASDGPIHQWIFGASETVSDSGLAEALGNGQWLAFTFESLRTAGTPEIISGPSDGLIFSSASDILPVQVFESSLNIQQDENMAFLAQNASIRLGQPGPIIIGGGNNTLIFHANGGPEAQVDLDIPIYMNGGNLLIASGGDTFLGANDIVDMDALRGRAGGDLEIGGNAYIAAMQSIDLEAAGAVNIYDSTLVVMDFASDDFVYGISAMVNSAGSGGLLRVKSRTGDVTLEGSTTVASYVPGGRVEILAPEGSITADGSSSEGFQEYAADAEVRMEAGGPNAAIVLRNAQIFAPVIDLRANGANSRIDLAFATLEAGQRISLLADGPGSMIQMGTGVRLAGPDVSLRAETIRVLPGVTVDALSVGTLRLNAANHDYNLPNETINEPFGLIQTGAGTTVIRGGL